MVRAREQVTEQLESFGFGAFRQFVRPPGLANQASGTVAVAFGEQDPREREAALGACRLIAYEATNGGGVAAFLPQTRLRPLAHESHARPARIIGDERRVSAEVRVSVRMAQDEPFNELPRRRVSDGFLYGGRIARLGLAREIDRILYRREIGRERKSVITRRRHVAGPRGRLTRHNFGCMPRFLECRVAVVPRSGRFMRLFGLLRLYGWPVPPRQSNIGRARPRSGN